MMTRVGMVGLVLLLGAIPSGPVGAAESKTVWACPMEDTPPMLSAGRCPVCGMKLVQRDRKPDDAKRMAAAKPAAPVKPPAPKSAGKALYHCPMHPQIVQDKPGECPICFMNLVPVKTGAVRVPVPGQAVVVLDAVRRRQLGITTAKAVRRSMARTLTLPGRVAHDPDLYATLAEWKTAEESLAKAESASAKASLLPVVEAARLKLAHFGFAEDELRTLAGSAHARHLILPGESVWIHASAFERDLGWIKRGQRAIIRAPALAGLELEGFVRAVEPLLDPQTRSATVRLLATNPTGARLPLETYATVVLTAERGEGVAIPREAVLDTGTRQLVYVVKGDELEPRKIRTGASFDGQVEVREGVTAGEEVVTSSNFLIDAESRIRADVAKISDGMNGTATPPAESKGGHAH